MISRSTKRLVLSLLGGLTLAAAIAVVLLPQSPTVVTQYGQTFEGSMLLLVLAGVFAALGVRYGYRVVTHRGGEPPFDQPPEEATGYDATRPGEHIDAQYAKATAPNRNPNVRAAHRQTVVRYLKEAAVDVLADAEDVAPPAARERVEDGSWSDDPRVQALFHGDSTQLPPRMRLRDWVSGESFERRVERTVAELQRIAELPDDAQSSPDDRDSELDASASTPSARVEPPTADTATRERATVTTADATLERDGHWNVGVPVVFLLGGLGFVLSNPTLVLAAIVPAGFAIYASLTRSPALNVDVERTVSSESPAPGERVRVAFTVENIGDRPLAELRAVDGVPESLRVVDGSPRLCATLEPGESATTTYTVEAFRGQHDFATASLWSRNVSGDAERTRVVDLDTTLTCHDPVETVPTTGQTTPYEGRIGTDAGGHGLEFYATRAYNSADPLSRIDWNHWARTGEPRTVQFRRTQAGTVVIVVDDRSVSRKARNEFTPDAVALGRHAAVRIADTLLAASNAVGGALLTRRAYERPSRGRYQRHQLEEFFLRPPSQSESTGSGDSKSLMDIDKQFFGGMDDDSDRRSQRDADDDSVWSPLLATDGGGIPLEWLRKRLSGQEQVVFVSPLLDDAPRRLVRTLQADGTDVTVLSPDVTSGGSPGRAIARIERHERLRALRRRGLRVVDWSTDEPLSATLERAQHRWSR